MYLFIVKYFNFFFLLVSIFYFLNIIYSYYFNLYLNLNTYYLSLFSSLLIALIFYKIKENAKKFNITTFAGGGDTISAIKNENAEDGFDYISNAGGAFLEWLEGNQSPGVIALKENKFI